MEIVASDTGETASEGEKRKKIFWEKHIALAQRGAEGRQAHKLTISTLKAYFESFFVQQGISHTVMTERDRDRGFA